MPTHGTISLLSYSFDYMTKKIHSFLIDEYYFSEKLIINIIIIYVTRKKIELRGIVNVA